MGIPTAKKVVRIDGQRYQLPLCLLLFGLVCWVFFPSIHGAFIKYDDRAYVTGNPHIQGGLTLANIVWALCHRVSANWHPVTQWSFLLDYQLYGLAPWGYHLTNVLLHAVNTVLVFWVLRRMTGATWRSLMVAALFGLHPLRVESVAWISERKDVLSTLFWLLTLWAYTRFAEEARKPGGKAKCFYGVGLGFFALGLMSKPMAVTLPCILLLLDYWPLERWKQQTLLSLLVEKIPFFLLSAIVSAITYVAQRNDGMMKDLADLSFGARLENALVSYVRYLGKLFWPVDLCALYPHPGQWPIELVLFSGLVILVISVLVWVQRRQRPYSFTGWFWYLGTLVPAIGLVQVGAQSMADRYTYIPSIGILMVLVWEMCRIAKGWRYQKVIFGATGGAMTLVCIVLTRHQIGYWKDGVSVWSRAVALTENNCNAHYNLGCTFYSLGRMDEAVRELQEAVRLKPGFAIAYNALAHSLTAAGRVNEALACYQTALKIRPDYVPAYNNLSALLLQSGRVDEAIIHSRKALEIDANDVTAINNLGCALLQNGRVDEAIACFKKALQIKPENTATSNNLSAALASQERLANAPSAAAR
jgi:tetratricopeptide (TPR) repeat protein